MFSTPQRETWLENEKEEEEVKQFHQAIHHQISPQIQTEVLTFLGITLNNT